MTTKEKKEMRAYEAARARLFPDEQAVQERQPTAYALPSGGSVPCGGGTRQLLVAGRASE